MEKSPIAPARSVASAAVSVSEPGGTMSEMWTRSGSLQPPCAVTSVTTRSANSLAVCFMAFSSGSVGHVDAGDERPHRRLRQEVGDAEVELPRLTHLGIRALVIRPRRQVATRYGQAECAGSDAGGPHRGSEVGQGQLAQLQEARILEISGLKPVEQRGGRCRLLLERRARNAKASADREQATELLGAVVELAAPAAVEQAVQAEMPQEIDFRGDRQAARRDRRALERVRIAQGDLGDGIDQPIAVEIPGGVGRAPIAACRVPDLVALRRAAQAEDDRPAVRVGGEDAAPVPTRASSPAPGAARR